MPMLQPVIPIFKQVPAGLAWYKPLVTTMQGNVSDFKSVNALPSFRLFTWFFVIPGVLLVLLLRPRPVGRAGALARSQGASDAGLIA